MGQETTEGKVRPDGETPPPGETGEAVVIIEEGEGAKVVEESQEQAEMDPKASSVAAEVEGKKQVEEEPENKIPEAPSSTCKDKSTAVGDANVPDSGKGT